MQPWFVWAIAMLPAVVLGWCIVYIPRLFGQEMDDFLSYPANAVFYIIITSWALVAAFWAAGVLFLSNSHYFVEGVFEGMLGGMFAMILLGIVMMFHHMTWPWVRRQLSRTALWFGKSLAQ